MRWHLSQPLQAGGLERSVGVEPARYGLVDDGLALLFQQGDEPLFGADVGVDELVGVVEVADDGSLFFRGRCNAGQVFEICPA